MSFVVRPNLPHGLVRLAAVGNHPAVINALRSFGTEVLILRDNPNIQKPVAAHADMTLLHLGQEKFLTYDSELCGFLRELGAHAELPRSEQRSDYPQDIGLNCLIFGKIMVCNTIYCAEEVKTAAETVGIKTLTVKQGYARCSVAVVDERSVITADGGIAQQLSGEGFDVLRIRPGFIELPGYDHGFIGGCCGKLSKDKILFCGDPMNHPDGAAIIDFIRTRGIDVVNVGIGNLFDFGGIIQIIE